jgi:hypothetical protein
MKTKIEKWFRDAVLAITNLPSVIRVSTGKVVSTGSKFQFLKATGFEENLYAHNAGRYEPVTGQDFEGIPEIDRSKRPISKDRFPQEGDEVVFVEPRQDSNRASYWMLLEDAERFLEGFKRKQLVRILHAVSERTLFSGLWVQACDFVRKDRDFTGLLGNSMLEKHGFFKALVWEHDCGTAVSSEPFCMEGQWAEDEEARKRLLEKATEQSKPKDESVDVEELADEGLSSVEKSLDTAIKKGAGRKARATQKIERRKKAPSLADVN